MYPISIHPVSEESRGRLVSLINFERHVHRHLDWRSPVDWIGSRPFLVAEQQGKMVAVLACPPEPDSVAWIRLFAATNSISPEKAWRELWPAARQELNGFDPFPAVVAMPLNPWFRKLLETSGFELVDRVVVLAWSAGKLPPETSISLITLRSMDAADLNAVQKIDQAAFGLIWQNSFSSLEIAFRQSVVATVAESMHTVIGYQISTATAMGGHLARLAVLPEFQGQGIGYALVRDLLARFQSRRARTVTVNTQIKNLASLSVYQRAGFSKTGEEFPVFQFKPE